jgi:hypothetical protein
VVLFPYKRAALLALVVLAGCGSEPQPKQAPTPAASDEQLIRGWSRALNEGDYPKAAGFFARGAVVVQEQAVRLKSRAEAIVFNSGLPCKADVTGVRDEGRTSLASFRLKRGPGGPCKGGARVRFTIKRGKFTEWRQLPDAPTPPGVTA